MYWQKKMYIESMYTSCRIKRINGLFFEIGKLIFYEALVAQVAEACNCKCDNYGFNSYFMEWMYEIFDILFPHFGNKAKWGMQCFKNKWKMGNWVNLGTGVRTLHFSTLLYAEYAQLSTPIDVSTLIYSLI